MPSLTVRSTDTYRQRLNNLYHDSLSCKMTLTKKWQMNKETRHSRLNRPFVCKLNNGLLPVLLHLQRITHCSLQISHKLPPNQILCWAHNLRHLHSFSRYCLQQVIESMKHPAHKYIINNRAAFQSKANHPCMCIKLTAIAVFPVVIFILSVKFCCLCDLHLETMILLLKLAPMKMQLFPIFISGTCYQQVCISSILCTFKHLLKTHLFS